jgi:hypothetical protein
VKKAFKTLARARAEAYPFKLVQSLVFVVDFKGGFISFTAGKEIIFV